MTVRKILYLPIETLARELEANLFLAHRALRRGYGVVVGGKGEVKQFARHVGEGVYLYKHWESEFPYAFDNPRRCNYCYVGLHQEGLVWIDDTTFFRRMTERGKTELLDLNLVRGDVQRQMLSAFNPALTPILRSVGSVSFDLLRPAYRTMFQNAATQHQKKWGAYVLVNTNFSHANPRKDDKTDLVSDRERASLRSVGRPLTETERQKLIDGIAYKKNLFDAYVVMLRVLSARFPELHFILRPHPSEDHSSWKAALGSVPNVHVVYEGNVVEWIMGALAVIHTGCTTAIESWALDKPVLRYNPIASQTPFESILPNEISTFASTTTELVALLEGVTRGEYAYPHASKVDFVQQYLTSITGELSAERILGSIEGVCPTQELDMAWMRKKIATYMSIGHYARMTLKKTRRWILTNTFVPRLLWGSDGANERAASFQKFPGIQVSRIQSFLDQLSVLEGETKKIHVRGVDTNTLYIWR